MRNEIAFRNLTESLPERTFSVTFIFNSVWFTTSIGGGAYWAGRAAAAHFLALVGKAYSLPAHFLMSKKSLFHYL